MEAESKARMEILRRIREEEKRVEERLSEIKWKVAVLSVKGGVGKSFVVANLAVALAEEGWRVGVLDADVHGPSIPRALGLEGLTLVAGPQGLLPATGPLGVRVVSMGLLLSDEGKAVLWRGPMKANFLRQILAMTAWGSLDYLLVDLPPGTGDEQLTIAQLVKNLSGVLVVTTPAKLSSSIAAKAGTFARLLGVRVLGVVENMSYFRCPACNTVHRLFGEGGGEALAEALKAPLLGKLPLDPLAANSMDEGKPLLLKAPEAEISKKLREVARRLEEAIEATRT